MDLVVFVMLADLGGAGMACFSDYKAFVMAV